MTLLSKLFKAGTVEKFRQNMFRPFSLHQRTRPALFALLCALSPMIVGTNAAEARGRSAHRAVQAVPAEGGPYEAIAATAVGKADPQFRSLFLSWKQQDSFQPGMVQRGTISVPSAKPIRTSVAFTSGFGVRSDPFRGGAAMHAGIDLAGPIGTPIYATADGVVMRGEWANGYGNLVEIDHGRGIATRYGHLSKIIAKAGDRVKRGELIALMGSTGRSTGSHLHYEVRLDGRAVNPVPYLQSADYLVAMQNRSGPRITAPLGLGGPEG